MNSRSLFLIAPFLTLSACTTPVPPSPAPQVSSGNPVRERMRDMQDVPSTAGATIPVLGSPALAKEWGAPNIERSADGSWRLRYMKKGELYGLVCLSLTSPVDNPASPPPWAEAGDNPLGVTKEVLHPQEWRTATVAGHSVRWYQLDGGSGADFPTYSTLCFPHTGSDGRTGYYVVHAWSDSDAKAASLLRKAAFLTGN